jgi:ketosteroid isomerase-like protein
MKFRTVVALVGLAISFALPTFAQQANTPDPQLRQRLLALIQRYSDAENNNDAIALAALYMEDAVEVTDRGPVNGRQAIEKFHADDLQKVHVSNHLITVDDDSPHIIGAGGNEMWATGGWSETIQGKNFGPIQIKGYWSVIRGGEDWKIRMLAWNIIPAPPATSLAQQTNAPDPQLREKLIAAIKKHTDALDKNDAPAVAANFTENGILVTPDGPVFGRESIEKYYVDVFKQVQLSDNLAPADDDSPHIIGTTGSQMWATGKYSATVKGHNFGPVAAKGYWSVIREGDDWRIRMLTFNTTPPPAATPSPTTTPSNK